LRFHFFQIRLAVLTALHLMDLHTIWFRHRFEGFASMPNLPTALLATPMPQAVRFLLQPITRWRLAAVVTVLSHPIFQPLDTLSKLPERLVKQLFDGLFALVISCTYFFIAWQMERLHAYIVLGFYVFDNVKVLSTSGFYA
jgi:hypothetical protein